MTVIPHQFIAPGVPRQGRQPAAAALAPRRPLAARVGAWLWHNNLWIVALLLIAAAGWAVKGHGVRGKITKWMKTEAPAEAYVIAVTGSRPNEGAFEVPLDGVVSCDLKLANGGIDPKSINPRSVMLVRTADQKQVAAAVKLTGDRQITLRPDKPLAPATNYTFVVTGGVRHRSGATVVPHAFSFTTVNEQDPTIRFEKVALPTATGTGFTCVTMGPDGKLWAGTDDGRFFVFPIEPDGTLGAPRIITSLHKHNNGPRLMIGFCFDPRSTPMHPIVWASNSAFTFNNAPDFSGKLTRLAGPDLEDVGDVVVNLPRSIRDHMNNQPAVGPDGAIYFPQGSSSSFGAPDEIWGMRIEHLLTSAILRVDPRRVTPGKPLDALTPDVGGHYDPRAIDAPLTLYATGVRNAYDLVWHSNGHLYVPTNGSSAGGHTPAGGGAKPIRNVSIAEDDWLFRIAPGMFHGHPNPFQGHHVLNGGNPTAGYDFAEVPQYPVGTKPDPKFVPAAHDFGKHVSPNGIIEYRGEAFGGRLHRRLMVCRYNVGSDIIVLTLDKHGNVVREQFGLPGLSELTNPLDLTEDQRTGNLYVSEYGAMRLTLLRPVNNPYANAE